MPSPFPGMDPYLEGARWMRVHSELSGEIARQLSSRLSPRYVAHTNERFVLTSFDAQDGVAVSATVIVPDAYVASRGYVDPAGQAGGGTALAVAPPAPLRVPTVIRTSVPHLTVEVRAVGDEQLVTAIEVLSPTNKRAGEGRTEYVGKRESVLRSAAHLIEIDLLRTGQRVPTQRPLPDAPYFVFLSRAEHRPIMDVWPVRLDQPLPTVPVPLLDGDADVALDLQQALASMYDTFRYHLTIDYARPPEVPLTAEQSAWAAERVAGRRRGGGPPAT